MTLEKRLNAGFLLLFQEGQSVAKKVPLFAGGNRRHFIPENRPISAPPLFCRYSAYLEKYPDRRRFLPSLDPFGLANCFPWDFARSNPALVRSLFRWLSILATHPVIASSTSLKSELTSTP